MIICHTCFTYALGMLGLFRGAIFDICVKYIVAKQKNKYKISNAHARVFRHRAVQRIPYLTPLSRIHPIGIQNRSKINPKWYYWACKERPKWHLGDPEASNFRCSRFYDSELGSCRSLRPPKPSQFASKILPKSIMKALCLTNAKQAAFLNCFGTSWTPILRCF